MKTQKNETPKPTRFRRDRLAQLMHNFGLNQVELAKHVAIDPAQVSRWLNGTNVPNSDTLALIADRLQVTADYLLGRVGENAAYYQMPELNPKEWELVLSYRDGSLVEAIQLLLDEMKKASQPPEEGAKKS